MDNLLYRIANVEIDVVTLVANLGAMNIPVSRKTIPKKKDELIIFSLPIGRYKKLWMFRCSLKDRSISCSGGVTKTFFGHNVWVFKKEIEQLLAIIAIVAAALREIGGLTLPASMNAITVERVEVTRHHSLDGLVSKRVAIDRLAAMFMARFPRRYFRNGATHDEPGTTGIGLNKSARVCRVYDPLPKFKEKPTHVTDDVWIALRDECEGHLRVELIFAKRELQSAGLSTVAAWADDVSVERLVAKRYNDYGLSVAVNTEELPREEVLAAHPAFVDAARFFFTNGRRGKRIETRNGSANRFKQYMAANGYCTDVSFSHHVHLAHGLSAVLQPQLAADLPKDLRANRSLFSFWWKGHRVSERPILGSVT